MANSTMTSVLSLVATVNSKLPGLEIKDGQMIFVQDKHAIALDFGGVRKLYTQIEELATEDVRTALLAPVTGRYYFVVDTGVLWTYQAGWVQITTPPSTVIEYADSVANKALEDAKVYTDAVAARITGSIDSDGNYVVMFGENFGWTVE